MMGDYLDAVAWNADGLAPAIAQDARTGEVLMLAWMSRESLSRTVDSGDAVYWSRSRAALWRKGETSGHLQRVVEIRIDCDADAILLRVEQAGGIACHTGRRPCFHNLPERPGGPPTWPGPEPVPEEPGQFRRGD